jgi:acetyltransferase (GNAT) family protein
VLYAALSELSPRVFGVDLTSYWEDRRRRNMFGKLARFYLFGDRHGALIGWSGYHLGRFAGRRCIYLDMAGIVPEWQGVGVITGVESRAILHELVLHRFERLYLVTRTPNPALYRMFLKAFGSDRVHPGRAQPVPGEVAAVAEAVAAWIGQPERLRASELKLVDSYAPYLSQPYAVRPRSGDVLLDRWFDSTLGVGDAFLVISETSLLHVAMYRLRRMVRDFGRASRTSVSHRARGGPH